MGTFNMKRFIINILVFFLLVGLADAVSGMVFQWLQSSVKSGVTHDEYYVCKQGVEDVLVMGSSRASHHYVSALIEDSLGMSCYNGGQDGNGIILQYGRWKMISKRHIPKLVIYDIEPAFDIDENDNFRYVDRLKPFADDSDVRNYISGLFPMEKVKLLSKMYRFNYKFLEIVSEYIHSSYKDLKGYRPRYEHIQKKAVASNEQVHIEPPVDETKLLYFRKLIEEVQEQGSTIVFVCSPYWNTHYQKHQATIENLCKEYNVPFLDYANSDICYDESLFADSMHLNDEGARVFTCDLIGKLNMLFSFF